MGKSDVEMLEELRGRFFCVHVSSRGIIHERRSEKKNDNECGESVANQASEDCVISAKR